MKNRIVRAGSPARTSRRIISATALHEKHHVPLLLCVTAQRIILRLLDKQPLKPFVRRGSFRNARRMNVKTFRGLREHARGRPLLRPEADPRENGLRRGERIRRTTRDAAADKSCAEKFPRRESRPPQFPARAVGGGKFARFDAFLGELLARTCRRCNRASRARRALRPQVPCQRVVCRLFMNCRLFA